MADTTFLTPEEKLSEYSDMLISTILGDGAKCTELRVALCAQLPPEAFYNENHIIYKTLYALRDRPFVPDKDFMELYLMRDDEAILEAKRFIDINAYADQAETPVIGYMQAVLKQFVRLKKLTPLTEDVFWLTLEKYKLAFQSVRLDGLYKEASVVLSDGIGEGRNFLQGVDASTAYVKAGIADLERIVDDSQGYRIVDSSEEALRTTAAAKPEKIGDFGLLRELNEHLGGIYTPNFYSIVAPTKGGKSKFTTRLAHTIAVEYGNNMVVFPYEGGKEAWWAQIRAIHFDWFYNRNEPDYMKRKTGVTQDVILRDAFPTDELRLLEQASATDLFNNPDYGRLYMIEGELHVDTFISVIDTAVKKYGAKAVLIDYLQLIDFPKSMKKSEAVGMAYKRFLAYLKRRNIVGISPAQMTQDFMREMAGSNNSDGHETRTAGGESAEVIRTPDYNIALYGSVEDIRAGSMKILSIPSRFTMPFPTFDICCNLGISMFVSLSELNNGP